MYVRPLLLTVATLLFCTLAGCSTPTDPIVGNHHSHTYGSPQASDSMPAGCRRDIRYCPNGSRVSRQPPHCEFQACR